MLINQKVLMSGADYFDDRDAINAYMDDHVPVDVAKAVAEHAAIESAFEQAGIEVVRVPAPVACQDGVYAANWALISGKKAIMSNLPNKRHAEQPYADKVLSELGYEIIRLPQKIHFSGQGDSLPCGRYLFTGTNYRTSQDAHILLAQETGLHVIALQTVPQIDQSGQPIINPITGWPDSFFYDLDLAIAILTPNLIAWCPDAFTADSQKIIRSLTDIDLIEVSYSEATLSSACNLVSTGDTVVMGSRAPQLQAAIEAKGLSVITVDVTELMKGGGFIRCTSLSL